MAKTYAHDPRRVDDDARITAAIKALNALQKEYEDVLAVTGYWTIAEVARCPLNWKSDGPKAEDKMSRAKIIRALKLLRTIEPDFATVQDAIQQTLF